MTIKLIGAFLVLTGCGGFGFSMAASHRREERAFRQYISALEFMECELSCRLSPLPQLCRGAGEAGDGCVAQFFQTLALELENQVAPDAPCCVRAALGKTPGMPRNLKDHLTELGRTLGRFDLPGQLRDLRCAAARANAHLQSLTENRDRRLRSYQTLGLCAGAALAILFL